ncbi:MAG: type II toxin-antitoxin system VapC family toxin [Gammaproteobacteria bacterium]|nr:type II toxin-antitoxin system VapC family toxin [Gammaproteobacteria bacterium]
MNCLLDTHCLLWMMADPDRLSHQVRALVKNPAQTLFLSAASGWEIALLWKLGRITLPDDPARFIPESLQRLSIQALPISLDVAIAAATLPLHHRDPFDRLLSATALREGMSLLSCDPQLDAYGVNRVWD